MTEHTRANLKARFEDGDTPSGQEYGDLIDSAVNISDTVVQVFAGHIEVSAITVTGAVCADDVFVSAFSAASLAGSINAVTLSATTFNTTAANITTLSATTILTNSLVVAGELVANVLNATTVSPQVIRASAVHHKNAHALVYGTGENVDLVSGALNAYNLLSARMSASPQGMVGFTQNGSTTVRYTGGVTAAMLVGYVLNLTWAFPEIGAAVSLFHDGVQVPESRATGTLVSGAIHAYSGSAIIKMKTSGAVDARVKISAASVYSVTIFSYNLYIIPVSFEF